jgi:ribose 5-phosphate isomerase A
MNQDELKALVGRAALQYVVRDEIVGVGTGSTVDHFIDALATMKDQITGAVSSSERSTQRLLKHGIRVFQTAEVDRLSVYIDGADEIDGHGCMIKGGGGALTREKIVADLAARFVCIADESKQVEVLGRFPLPIEIIPMARRRIQALAAALGGVAQLREGFSTDNGMEILDVSGLRISDPLAMEREINQWPGVVSCGIFAMHRANVCLLGTSSGVRTLTY